MDTIGNPYDTDAMFYDFDKHLYILNHEWVKNQFGLDFIEKEGSLTRAKDRMYRISRNIYNFIYAHTHYIKQMQKWLAVDYEMRPFVQQALEEQARYEYDMSAEFFSEQSGINVVNGVQIPIDRFRGIVRISPYAEDVMRQNRMLYQGQRFLTEKNFADDEYDY
jgi:hypothetical protein